MTERGILAAVSAMLVLAGLCCAAAVPTAQDMAKLAEGNNEFAADLYAKLKTKEGNLFYSPFSISSALAMTWAGARGNTAAEMAKALHFTLPGERLHPALAGLTDALNARGKAGGYQLAVANRLWGEVTYNFLPEFLDLNRKHYGAGLEELDFIGAAEASRKTINAWVEKQTQDRIKELLKPGMVKDDTRLVLTNAIYFKGEWASVFDGKDTHNLGFQLRKGDWVEVPTMKQTAEFGYLRGEGFQALEMPYKGGDLSMVALLPEAADGLAEFEKKLTAENVAGWLPKLAGGRQQVEVLFPQLKITCEYNEMERTLAAMGIADAFVYGRADFSGMDGTRELYISKVVHKAFVEVNEKGTEAAAATAVIMVFGAAPGRPRHPVFRADHPFVFLIRDNRSGSILFVGRVTDPRTAKG